QGNHLQCNRHVCFTPESGHVHCTSLCLLWARSRHWSRLLRRKKARRAEGPPAPSGAFDFDGDLLAFSTPSNRHSHYSQKGGRVLGTRNQLYNDYIAHTGRTQSGPWIRSRQAVRVPNALNFSVSAPPAHLLLH